MQHLFYQDADRSTFLLDVLNFFIGIIGEIEITGGVPINQSTKSQQQHMPLS